MPDNRDDHDELASWLNKQIQPLPPPPGTFELIKRRARHRKLRRLAITVASAAAVVTVAVVVPQVVPLHITGPPASGQPLAVNNSRPAASSVPQMNGSATRATTSPTPSASSVAPSASASVPPDFAPESITFIGLHTGWAIGQAGTPGRCPTQYCTSIARTDNAGQSWSEVPAPLTGPPDGATGVGGIRFLDASDGWAFGPELWATHDGGKTWTQIPTNGQRVTDLETVGDRAFALFATCSGTRADFAQNCTSFTLQEAQASGDDWAPVGAATTGLGAGGKDTSAMLALTGTRGFLLAPNGTLFAGPVDGSGAWQPLSAPAGKASCAPGQARQDGQPSAGMLAAASPTSLALLCLQPASDELFLATSGAASPGAAPPWSGAVAAPVQSGETSLTEAPDGTIVLATDTGISVLPAGATAWRQATFTGGAPAGGFSYVGMTANSQGVALPADTALHEVWLTFDGGMVWQAYPLRG